MIIQQAVAIIFAKAFAMNAAVDYIFCINTGRSGSNYLYQLFCQVKDCQAFHEPEPKGNEKAMRLYLQGHPEAMKTIAQRKAEIIKEIKLDCSIYVETNHCFIKGFGWFMPQYLSEEKIGVIILNRDKSKIVESHLRIGSSPLLPRGRDWLMAPDKTAPLIRPPAVLRSPKLTYYVAYCLKAAFRSILYLLRTTLSLAWRYPQWLTKYELSCLCWYVEETDAQAKVFQQQFPKIRYYEVDIDELNDSEQVLKMFAYFGCHANKRLSEYIGKATNLKQRNVISRTIVS